MWHLPGHGPERKPDAVPAEVAQAAVWFEPGVSTDIGGEELLRSRESEGGSDAPDSTNGLIIQSLAHESQSAAVHEHYAIHELHSMAPACVQHLLQISPVRTAGLFADNMLVGRVGSPHPFLSNA